MQQEKILLDPMFDVPGSDVSDVIIDEQVVRGQEQAIYRRNRVSRSDSENETTTAPSSESLDDQDNAPRKVASANGV